MNPAIVVLVAMTFISAMLAVTLGIAWRTFGRPRHAFTWSVAFAVAAVQWVANIVVAAFHAGYPWWFSLVSGLIPFTCALLALGFRERAGLRPHAALLLTGAALAAVLVTIATFLPHAGLKGAIPLLFGALTLTLAVAAVRRPGERANPAERAAIAMLLAFVLLSLLCGSLALMQGQAEDVELRSLYQLILLLGLPAAFTGTGLFTLFLLAADMADRMRRLADRDPLTGVLNRRGFVQAAERAIAAARRRRQPLAVAVADLDGFKSINDRFGHAAGDRALQHFADHVQEAIRREDLFGRMGGEEFALLFVNATAAAAAEVIDRLRVGVSKLDISGVPSLTLTSSFGLADLGEAEETLARLLARADGALYRSKIDGRNRVTIDEGTFSPVQEAKQPSGTAAR